MGERENVDGGGNERGQVELEIVAVEETAGHEGVEDGESEVGLQFVELRRGAPNGAQVRMANWLRKVSEAMYVTRLKVNSRM